MTIEKSAEIRTEAAATSLITLIFGLFVVSTKSAILSIAVFIPSDTKTIDELINTIHHS